MIILVQPVVPEVPEPPTVAAAAPTTNRLTFTWTGTDGVPWDLTAGPVELARGMSGFGIPKPTHWHDEAPTIDGASWQGMRTGPREVFLPVHVKGGKGGGMIDLERAFFAGLDPREEGTLRVTTTNPDDFREMRLRYDEGAEGEYELDPVLLGYAPYPLRFVAADPYWRGTEVTEAFVNETSVNFFPGPPFTISNSNTLSTSSVVNPGDQPAYPRWQIDGPCSAFSVGVGTSLVTATVDLLLGEYIVIDMDPRALTVVDGTGTDRWDVLTDATFSSIPGGSRVDLITTMTDADTGSSVTLTFTPRYRRAW